MEETIHIRKGLDQIENLSIATVTTSYFLSAACSELTKHNAAWFYLREAITLGQLLGIHEEGSYVTHDVESTMRRRMFWLLFVTER